MEDLSLLRLHGEHTSSCGYCNYRRDRPSFGADAERLSVLDYQALCDAGWRRSGTYLYHPMPADPRACCPQHTIRLDTAAFASSKAQRSLLRRFHRYLRGEVDLLSTAEVGRGGGEVGEEEPPSGGAQAESPLAIVARLLSAQVDEAAGAEFEDLRGLRAAALAPARLPVEVGGLRAALTSSLPLAVHAALRKAGHADVAPPAAIAAAIAARVEAAHRSTGSPLAIAVAPSGHLNFAFPSGTYAAVGGGGPIPLPAADAPADTPPVKKARGPTPLPTHTFRVDMVPADFHEESFRLWARYQAAVHGDSPSSLTRFNYTNFLCTHPLVHVPRGGPTFAGPAISNAVVQPCVQAVQAAWEGGEGGGAGLPLTASPTSHAPSSITGFGEGGEAHFSDLADTTACGADLTRLGYGAFHQRYYLDGALVAVGVVDILPSCLSSVYVFYDPVFSSQGLDLGKLTALREIQWVQRAAVTSPRLKFYYMGLFVASCSKMRYKASYKPSELRCPLTGAWVPAAVAVPLLDAARPPRSFVGPQGEAEWEAASLQRRAVQAGALGRVPIVMVQGGEEVDEDAVVTFRTLNERGKTLLKPLLLSWLAYAGTGAGTRALVGF